jgi:hypothetical protein
MEKREAQEDEREDRDARRRGEREPEHETLRAGAEGGGRVRPRDDLRGPACAGLVEDRVVEGA